MSSEVDGWDSVIFEAWSEYRYPQPAVDEPSDRFMRAARVFRSAMAAELERLAADIDPACDPAGDAWMRAEVTGRRDVRRTLLARASELRGEGKDGDG